MGAEYTDNTRSGQQLVWVQYLLRQTGRIRGLKIACNLHKPLLFLGFALGMCVGHPFRLFLTQFSELNP